MDGNSQAARLRLAEPLVALSLVTDLGMGNLPEDAIRSCLLATELARLTSCAPADLSDIYYATLLRFVGCTAYAHEEAVLFDGDDIAVRAAGARTDFDDPRQVAGIFVLGLTRNAGLLGRVRLVAHALSRMAAAGREMQLSHCEVGTAVVRRLGLSSGVQRALYETFERWDGKGGPQGLAGEALSLPVGFAHVAHAAVLFGRLDGPAGALDVIQRRAGKGLDPAIALAFRQHGRQLLQWVTSTDSWKAVLEAEPEPHRQVPAADIDQVARAFGDMVDLKSLYTRGHSSGVAALAEDAARRLGMAPEAISSLRRASLLHDLGRAGVANGIWDKPGPLTTSEWEQVRLHPYNTERILRHAPALSPLAAIAGMHHERLDGSGYHRQVAGQAIPMAARILAAADVLQALTQERPHPGSRTPDQAAAAMFAMEHGLL